MLIPNLEMDQQIRVSLPRFMFMAEAVLKPRSVCSDPSDPSVSPWNSQGQEGPKNLKMTKP